MNWRNTEQFNDIIGANVNGILMSEDRLTFQTDKGLIEYEVEGDCCSHSYFFDFYGVKHLLDNGPVTAFESVDLSPGDPGYVDPDVEIDYEYIRCYGYRLTTEHPTFGPVSSVVSFRNSSNGYYGGSMERTVSGVIQPDQVVLTKDKIG